VTNHTADADALGLAEAAVRRAGDLIRSCRPRVVADKGDRDPKSDIDLAAEHLIREFLDRETPDIPVLGEEEGGEQGHSQLVWVIDPIDGTVNYIHGLPLYAVSLSLLDNRSPVVAATHLPFLMTTFTARRGNGAFLDQQRIQVSTVTSLREALISIDQFTFGSTTSDATNALRMSIIQHLAPRVQRLRVFGTSTIELAWTAAGQLDACIIAANQPWDTSAGVLLAREAGAQVFDLAGDEYTLASRTTLVASPGIAADLLTVIRSAVTPASSPSLPNAAL
jgi:myo-inositol-1(or 4)-monophosphatase